MRQAIGCALKLILAIPIFFIGFLVFETQILPLRVMVILPFAYLGNAKMQLQVAEAYESSQGASLCLYASDRFIRRAKYWYKRSLDNGNLDAAYPLASLCHNYSSPAAPSYKCAEPGEALPYFLLAAKHGNKDAMYHLAGTEIGKAQLEYDSEKKKPFLKRAYYWRKQILKQPVSELNDRIRFEQDMKEWGWRLSEAEREAAEKTLEP